VSWFGLGSNKELEAVYLEECPDAQKDDLDKVIREKEAFFLSELNGDGWTAVNLNDKPGTSQQHPRIAIFFKVFFFFEEFSGISLYSKAAGSLFVYKTKGFIKNVKPKQILALYLEEEFEKRKIWDTRLIQYSVVQKGTISPKFRAEFFRIS
jgi:hypothetical protein